MYDPKQGVWVQRDPVMPIPNLYQYVNDDPLGLTDPSGLMPPIHPQLDPGTSGGGGGGGIEMVGPMAAPAMGIGNSASPINTIVTTYPGQTGPAQKQGEINVVYQAISHYHSKVGGTVPAGQGLYAEIRSSSSYKSGILGNSSEVANRIKAKLSSVSLSQSSGDFPQNPGSNIGMLCPPTLGSFAFDIKYDAHWKATSWKDCKRTVSATIKVSFTQNYFWNLDRKESSGTALWKLVEKVIPSALIGEGTPFHIPLSLEETYTLSVEQEKPAPQHLVDDSGHTGSRPSLHPAMTQ